MIPCPLKSRTISSKYEIENNKLLLLCFCLFVKCIFFPHQEPGKKFGLDLAALNIQRAREHGVPSYNRWREWCGLPVAKTFDDLLGWMGNKTVYGYTRTYQSPEDIDLWSAGISEKPLPGKLNSGIHFKVHYI